MTCGKKSSFFSVKYMHFFYYMFLVQDKYCLVKMKNTWKQKKKVKIFGILFILCLNLSAVEIIIVVGKPEIFPRSLEQRMTCQFFLFFFYVYLNKVSTSFGDCMYKEKTENFNVQFCFTYNHFISTAERIRLNNAVVSQTGMNNTPLFFFFQSIFHLI